MYLCITKLLFSFLFLNLTQCSLDLNARFRAFYFEIELLPGSGQTDADMCLYSHHYTEELTFRT